MNRALVISGGGSKGAFAIGVIKQLFRMYPRLQFDLLVGTSTGSLIVPLVALGEIDALEKLYTSQRTENIILKNRLGDRLNNDSIYDANLLWQLLVTNYTDDRYNALLSSAGKVFLTTTCLQSEQLVVFTTATNSAITKEYQVRSLVNASHFRKAVMASACQPVFLPPVKVNKDIPGEPNPQFQFVDGGVKKYAGIQMAIDNGATEIFTIYLSADDNTPDNVEYGDLLTILEKTIDIFTGDVGKNDLIVPTQFNQALQYIAAVKSKIENSGINSETVNEFFNIPGLKSPYQDKLPVKLFIIRPDAPLGGGFGGLIFDPAEMEVMVQKGEQSANDFIASLNPGDITWG